MLRPYPTVSTVPSTIYSSDGNTLIYKNLLSLYGRLAFYHHLSDEEKAYTTSLFSDVKECIEDYILATACGEIRHLRTQSIYGVYQGNENLLMDSHPLYQDFIYTLKRMGTECGRLFASKQFWEYFENNSYEELFEFFELLFISHRWSKAYGGFPWGYIMHCALNLARAKDFPSQILAFDRVMHAAHCCASMFLESKLFYFNTHYILNVLEFKRRAYPCCWSELDRDAYNLPPIPSSPERWHCYCYNPTTIGYSTETKNIDELTYIHKQFVNFKKTVLKGKVYKPWIALIS